MRNLEFSQQRQVSGVALVRDEPGAHPLEHATTRLAAMQAIPEMTASLQHGLKTRKERRKLRGRHLHGAEIPEAGGIDPLAAPGQRVQGRGAGDMTSEPAHLVDLPHSQLELGQKSVEKRTLAHPRRAHEDAPARLGQAALEGRESCPRDRRNQQGRNLDVRGAQYAAEIGEVAKRITFWIISRVLDEVLR